MQRMDREYGSWPRAARWEEKRRTQRRFRDVVREDVSDRVTWRQMIVTTPKEEGD